MAGTVDHLINGQVLTLHEVQSGNEMCMSEDEGRTLSFFDIQARHLSALLSFRCESHTSMPAAQWCTLASQVAGLPCQHMQSLSSAHIAS